MKPTSRFWLFVIVPFMLVGLMLSCSKQDKRSEQTTDLIDLTLEVDSAKLGDHLEIAALDVRIPRGWNPVIENIIEMMQRHAENDTGRLSMKPEHAYSSENGSVLVISRFLRSNQPGERFTDWAMEVGQTYLKVRTEHETDLNWIAVNGMEALQVVTKDERSVHVKILVSGTEPISIDYTIPKDIWPSQSSVIGSCIGSIERNRSVSS